MRQRQPVLVAVLILNPLPGLDVAAVADLDFCWTRQNNLLLLLHIPEMTAGVPEIQRGIYSKSKNTTTNVSTNVRVTYNNVYAGKHNLTLGANIDYYLTQLDNVSITGYGVGTIKSAAAINQSIQGTRKAEGGR